MAEAVVIDAVRTPIGRRKGTLREVRPETLLSTTIDGLLERTGLDPQQVEDVIAGCVTEVGEQGADIGRVGSMLSRLGQDVPAVSLNRFCGSGQQAIHFGAQAVAAGDAAYVIAGGVESMTRVPMFSDVGPGFPAKMSPLLLAAYELIHQGESAERIAERYGLSRAALDDFSFESHVRAATAIGAGRFRSQIVPIQGSAADGASVMLDRDEGVRMEPDRARMSTMETAFRPDGAGVITAANSSQISDAAGVLLIADRDRALADGFKPRARFRARVAVGGDPTLQLLEVIPATKKALERAGLSLSDIDVFEINEAFASVVLAWASELKPDMARVNPFGGAIALGHPLGATGAILATKLINELEQLDGQFGLQVMCIGLGMATATVYERL